MKRSIAVACAVMCAASCALLPIPGGQPPPGAQQTQGSQQQGEAPASEEFETFSGTVQVPASATGQTTASYRAQAVTWKKLDKAVVKLRGLRDAKIAEFVAPTIDLLSEIQRYAKSNSKLNRTRAREKVPALLALRENLRQIRQSVPLTAREADAIRRTIPELDRVLNAFKSSDSLLMTKIRLALNKARPALALALAPPLGNAHTDREGKFIIKILRKILKYRTASVPFTVQDEHPDLPPDTPPADAGPDPDPAKDLPLISDEEAAVPGKIVAVVQQEEEEESASGYRIQTTLESPLFLMAFVEPVSAGTAPSQVTPGSTTTLVNTAYSKLKAMSPAEIQKTAEAIDRMWSEEEALAALQGPLGALRALVSLASRDPAFAETVKASLAFVPPPPPVPLGVTASGWPEEPLFVPGPDAGGQVKPTTVRLAATVTMTDLSTGSTVTWSSSAPSIAKVDATGLVSAVADGTASIKATSADGKRSYADSVTVVSGGWIKTEVK